MRDIIVNQNYQNLIIYVAVVVVVAIDYYYKHSNYVEYVMSVHYVHVSITLLVVFVTVEVGPRCSTPRGRMNPD